MLPEPAAADIENRNLRFETPQGGECRGAELLLPQRLCVRVTASLWV